MGHEGMSRRDFIVKTALGLATAGLGASPVRAANTDPGKSSKIVYRTLGKTHLRIPVVSFGVMNSDSPDLIRKALDMGIKLLDTAHLYLRGNSEKVIGEIIEEKKCRDKVYIATKMFFARDREKQVFSSEGSGKYAGATEGNFAEQLDMSLKRLRTDYVDILYLHNCSGPLMPAFEPMIKAFVKAKESGKVRLIGISTHANEPETIRAAVDAGPWDVVLTSYNFMQDHKEAMKRAIAYAAQKGVGVIAMKTQGGVRLNREKKMEINHEAALKWVLNDSNVCTTIPGITTFDQMDLDFRVMSNLLLSDGENRDLEASSMVSGPLYCQQCRSCISSCLQAVEIPTLMRAYMYAEGYGNLIHAGLTLDSLPAGKGLAACRNCETCTAVCRHGIGIRDRLNFLMTMNATEERSLLS
ncbi:MAG: aldo/keto reductase [Desulfobacterales bacterium]|nr:aldo/keto reductase [Desulfobacterales bacterium]MBL7173395.1 aldo/keto reductase [Desulfobacteraceae bacterium]